MTTQKRRSTIGDLKTRIDIADFIRSYGVELRKDGNEYKACCPFHDERTPSFTVTPANGLFKCFGCGAGGSVVDFAMQWHGLPLADAIKRVEEWAGGVALQTPEQAAAQRQAHAKKRDEWVPVVPVPLDAPDPTFKHRKYDKPAFWWPYLDATGRLIGYVARFHFAKVDKETGEESIGKDVIPTVYAQHAETGKREWRWLSFPKPRPLYGLDLLAKHPDALVLIVEGEKTADAARALLPIGAEGVPPIVVISWPGGGKAIGLVDWSPLQGRRCALWPDADAPGFATMEGWINGKREAEDGIAQLITGIAASIKVIQPPAAAVQAGDGWDIADAKAEGWTTADLLQHIKGSIRDHRVPVPMQVADPEPAPPINDNEPPLDSYADFGGVPDYQDPDEEEPFTYLGYGRGPVFYYMPARTQHVTALTASAHSKMNLLALAPLGYWVRCFPKKGGEADWDMAANAMIQRSQSAGLYDPGKVRGRGAWWDDGRPAIHLGHSVVIDGKQHPLHNAPSQYIYEASLQLPVTLDNPLANGEAIELVRILELCNWDRPVSAKLLAGFLLLAPICGALDWRSHAWITGESGSGKSTIMEKIVKRVLGRACLFVQSETSAAGVRQTLENDALPVLFDEAESENHKASARIQDIMGLVTAASSETGAKIIKGSAGGKSMSYEVRSMFIFSSIAINLQQFAAKSRVSVFGLRKSPATPQSKERYRELERRIIEVMTEEWVKRLHARAIHLIPVIRRNARIFSDASSAVLGTKRLGDQIGTLLAGAYALHAQREITPAEATKWLEAQDWTEETQLEEQSDQQSCLSFILESVQRAQGKVGQFDRTIGELVEIVTWRRSDADIEPAIAHDALKRIGIRLSDDMQKLYISNNAKALKKLLGETSWASSWNRTLARLPGAKPHEKPVRFAGGVQSRAVEIPIAVLFE